MVRIKLTMSGSIGSGSVPVTPSAVEGEEVVVGGVVEVELVPEANARPAEAVNSTRSRTNVSFEVADLVIECLHFQRRCALGGD
jgi:hypothetical protein